MSRIKIPQDVEREDRIVGPLTVRQLLFSLAGAALMFSIYQLWATYILPSFIFVLMEAIALLITLLFVFFKFNDKNFLEFLGIVYKLATQPKVYIWQKDDEFLSAKPEITARELKTLEASEASHARAEKAEKSRLEKLSQILSLGGKIGDEDNEIVTRSIGQFATATADDTKSSDTDIEDVLQGND
jgi:hypothetical protein